MQRKHVLWGLNAIGGVLVGLGLTSCLTTEYEGVPEGPLEGIADLHLHMYAEDAFGGGWLHGTVDGDGMTALPPCDGGVPGDHANIRKDVQPLFDACAAEVDLDEVAADAPLFGALLNLGGTAVAEFVGQVPGTEGDTGIHVDRTNGWPELDGWPRWDGIAHQQVWEEHLKEAWEDGVRVEVVSAVTLNYLCLAMPEENLDRPDCDEMDDIILQLQKTNEFADAHDWVEIARSPQELRRIVHQDKLAIVLSIEASHIFGGDDWREQLDEVYALGVRTLQPVHQLDNRFGGAALHNSIFHMLQFIETCHVDTDCALTSDEITMGFDVDENCKNVKGLTEEGRELIQEMMNRGMMIDAAHLSEQSFRDLYDLSVENDYYPIYLSHAHFREVMTPEKQQETKTTASWQVGMVRETGGMIGLRTAHEETSTYENSDVSNTCQGSSRSFAQAYDYGRKGLKVKMGLGSDLNGFIQQTRPRFGPEACSASFPEEAACQAMAEEMENTRLDTDFDVYGLGHAGLIGDLLDDLDLLGSDTSSLRNSAEDFALMWERSVGPRDGKAEEIDDLDTTGITILPPHDERKDMLPAECG